MPPGRTRSAAERSSASWRSGRGVARQRRSGRCARTPRPEHGASTSARSKPSSSGGRAVPSRLDDRDVGAAHPREVLAQLARAGRIDLDRRHVAAQLPRLPARCRAEVEHALAVRRADAEAGELRAAALRPDPPVGHQRLVHALDAKGARQVRLLRAGRRLAAHEPDDCLERLVHRPHQGERAVFAEHSHEGLVDPVGVRLLQRPVGQRVEERLDPVGQPSHHRVRERDGPLEPGAADELDRLVDGRVLRGVGVAELVRAEPQRRTHRRVELPHRPPAERLDRVVERPYALHRAVGEPLRERALALVEALGGAAEGAVGIRVLLEHAQQHLVRGAPRGTDHERQTRIAQPITARSQRR